MTYLFPANSYDSKRSSLTPSQGQDEIVNTSHTTGSFAAGTVGGGHIGNLSGYWGDCHCNLVGYTKIYSEKYLKASIR
jgi:hypothetical protein